jgi:hypothetical protein
VVRASRRLHPLVGHQRRGTVGGSLDTPNDVAQVLLASYANDVRVVALDSHPLAAMARLVADAWRP